MKGGRKASQLILAAARRAVVTGGARLIFRQDCGAINYMFEFILRIALLKKPLEGFSDSGIENRGFEGVTDENCNVT